MDFSTVDACQMPEEIHAPSDSALESAEQTCSATSVCRVAEENAEAIAPEESSHPEWVPTKKEEKEPVEKCAVPSVKEELSHRLSAVETRILSMNEDFRKSLESIRERVEHLRNMYRSDLVGLVDELGEALAENTSPQSEEWRPQTLARGDAPPFHRS